MMLAISTLLHRLHAGLLGIFLVITTLAVMIPLAPEMPQYGLDPSWMFAVNQAVAQHLVFGRDFIFTYGPYASIDDRVYHPATDHLVLFGSGLIALAYSLLLLLLMRTGRLAALWLFGLFLCACVVARDALLFSCPLLIAVVFYLLFLPAEHGRRISLSPRLQPWLPALLIPLGILPLIKGSFLILALIAALVCSLMCWFGGYKRSAWLSILSPTAALVFFWCVIGQPLSALPLYFVRLGPIVSGYTDAMALSHYDAFDVDDLVWRYIFAGLGLVLLVSVQGSSARRMRWLLVLAYLAYLFLAFKAGLVRPDGHIRIAGTAFGFAGLLALFFVDRLWLLPAVLLAAYGWFGLDISVPAIRAAGVFEAQGGTARNDSWTLPVPSTDQPTSVAQDIRAIEARVWEVFCRNSLATYGDAWQGLTGRLEMTGKLQRDYKASLMRIRQQLPIPHFDGTTDMYSDQQAYLLASDNTWSPRPVFQSYSVYTPELAQLNLAHLHGNAAPQNILFRVEPIDDRLPALEDGLSLPTLISNYALVHLDHDLAYLKRQPGDVIPVFQQLTRAQPLLGDEYELPPADAPLQIAISLHKTLVGHIFSFLHRLPLVLMQVRLADGEVYRYRFVPSMAESGFIISPLVTNTSDFVDLAVQNPAFMAGNAVRSIAIYVPSGEDSYWQNSYTITVSRMAPGGWKSNGRLSGQSPVLTLLPAAWSQDKPDCVAGGWLVNGRNTAVPSHVLSGRLSASGYLTTASGGPVSADAVYFTLRDAAGSYGFIKADEGVPDFGDEYPEKAESRSWLGVAVNADISGLQGTYMLGLAVQHDGLLHSCVQADLPLHLSSLP